MLKNELIEIGACISKENKAVLEELEACIEDIVKYYDDYKERFQERDVEEDEDEDTIQWIGLVDSLIDNGYVSELDWKCDKEEFIDAINNLNGMKEYGVAIDNSWFDENDSIVEWCSILDDKWKEKEVCVAALDIYSDSYIIFPVSLMNFEKIKKLASAIDQRIELAKDL